MTKVEAVIRRERVETVISAVEQETGHVGITVMEVVGHGKQRGITHEYRGRIFESRFLPKAYIFMLVRDEIAEKVMQAIADAANTDTIGDGIVWRTKIDQALHIRTGQPMESYN
jgi:nitrogen regulatory protein P-II 1